MPQNQTPYASDAVGRINLLFALKIAFPSSVSEETTNFLLDFMERAQSLADHLKANEPGSVSDEGVEETFFVIRDDGSVAYDIPAAVKLPR